MSRSPAVRSSQIEGQENATPFFVNSGRMTSVNGQVRYFFTSPCDGVVTSFNLSVSTTFTNAAATMFMGTAADTNNDDLLNDFVIQNVTGNVNVIGSALWVSKAVSRGAEYAIGFTNADTTGVGNISLTIAPTALLV